MSNSVVPQHCPSPRELDDLELLSSGALAPIAAFNEPGSPVTLELPPDVLAAAEESGEVELVDPEGLPLARVAISGEALAGHPAHARPVRPVPTALPQPGAGARAVRRPDASCRSPTR